jgi:hypothetical protein
MYKRTDVRGRRDWILKIPRYQVILILNNSVQRNGIRCDIYKTVASETFLTINIRRERVVGVVVEHPVIVHVPCWIRLVLHVGVWQSLWRA